MTQGAIDLKIVSERLDILAGSLRELRALPSSDLAAFTADRRNIWAADALLRRAIEALFDTLRHLLAKAHGRGGLEYREVARLAIEHGLVSGDAAAAPVLKIAGYRNRLAHHYDEVTPEELYALVRSHLHELEHLADQLRQSAARLAGAGSRSGHPSST
jgi:uncharacterized protein YutE (UPF0331/DUF86 family)